MAVQKRYSVAEAAEISGKSTRSIYRDIYSGSLPAAKCGAVWRIKEKDLETYCETSKMSRYDQIRTSIVDARSQLTSDQRMALVGLLVADEKQRGTREARYRIVSKTVKTAGMGRA